MSEQQQHFHGIAGAVKKAGGQVLLARQLGVTQQAVSIWLRQGYVPLRRAAEIEAEYGIPRATLVNPAIADALAPADI